MAWAILVVMHGLRSREAVGVEQASLQGRANKIGEAVDTLLVKYQSTPEECHLQSKESKSLQRLLECALVDERRRVSQAAEAIVVVLCGEDEGCKPKVREDPGKRPHVALVLVRSWKDQSRDVEQGVDGSLHAASVKPVVGTRRVETGDIGGSLL
jgi:hypothetical protein